MSSAFPDGLPRSVERVAAYLVGVGHEPAPALGMAANLLGEALTHQQLPRRCRDLTMTPQEREGFANALQARRVLIEGALLSLDGSDVREGAVLSAHALCEARQARRPVVLRLGGASAHADQVGVARARLSTELDSIDALVEAAVEDKDADTLQQGVGGAKPHPRVVHLQNRLNMLGHRVAADGKFGPVTTEAVKDFQAKAGMEPNGVVDEGTRNALRHGRQVVEVGPAAVLAPEVVEKLADVGDGDPNKETVSADPAPPASEKAASESGKASPLALGRGVGERKDRDVQRMQVHLGAAGFPVAQDGKFGPKTHAAVKKFQRKHGLEPSGAGDDRTIRALRDAARSNLKEAVVTVNKRAIAEAVQAQCSRCGAPTRGGVCQRGHRQLQEAWDTFDELRKGSKVYATRHHTTAEPGRVLQGRSLTVESNEGGTLAARDDVSGDLHTYNRPAMRDALSTSKAGAQAQQDRDLDMRHDMDRGDLDESVKLEESPQTAALSVTHAPIGKGGKNWVTASKPGNTGQLPAYIQNVRNAIMRGGKSESEATAIAVGRIKDWAAGGGGVSAEVKAAAAKAIAEWEAMKGAAHAKSGAKMRESLELREDWVKYDKERHNLTPGQPVKVSGALGTPGKAVHAVQQTHGDTVDVAASIGTMRVPAHRLLVQEADAKADFPETLACPECGARAARGAVRCPRGHKMAGAHKLMHALVSAERFDRELELLLRECVELRETWADFDSQRHKASWGKLVKAGPMPGHGYKDSPGRGPTGKMRNFDSMSPPKLAATLEALAVHGEDPEAHQAAMHAAGKKLGMKIHAPQAATHTLLDEAPAQCPRCGAPMRDGGVCQRGHRLEEAWSPQARAAAAAARRAHHSDPAVANGATHAHLAPMENGPWVDTRNQRSWVVKGYIKPAGVDMARKTSMIGDRIEPISTFKSKYLHASELPLREAVGSIDKGAFHRWLGKDDEEPITDADIARGLAAGGHPAKMAQFAKNARGWGK